jgi:hypothetical protein
MFANRSRGFLLLIVVGVFGSSQLAAATPAEDKPIAVTAAKLAEAYATDPAAFDKTYKDKVVEVEGVVETPKAQDSTNKKDYVMLHGFEKKGDVVPTLVRCELTKELEGLKAGQAVRIKGTCRGHKKTVLAAEIVDCKLIKKE